MLGLTQTIALTEVMTASSTVDSSHWHLTAGDSTDSSISSIASATYMGQEAPDIGLVHN